MNMLHSCVGAGIFDSFRKVRRFVDTFLHLVLYIPIWLIYRFTYLGGHLSSYLFESCSRKPIRNMSHLCPCQTLYIECAEGLLTERESIYSPPPRNSRFGELMHGFVGHVYQIVPSMSLCCVTVDYLQDYRASFFLDMFK